MDTERIDFMQCITQKEMRDINRTCILEYMRQRGAVSRSAIAQDLSLSLSSVVRITDDLVNEQIIHLMGEYEFSGGRRRPLIALNREKNCVVSISLGGRQAIGCLCDITGNIITAHTISDHHTRGVGCISLIRALIQQMLGAARNRIVRGISIGVPGIVIDGNRVMAAPAVGLDDFCLADELAPFFPYPIFIENDVNLAALAELWFGAGKQSNDLLYIHIGTLIGMGIIQNRCILRGAHTGAGELGYMLVERGYAKHAFRKEGALEQSISGTALGMRATKALGIEGAEGTLTSGDLFTIAKNGVPWAEQIVEDYLQTLSAAIVNAATLLDPEQIVLGGGVMQSACIHMDALRNYTDGKTPNPIVLTHSTLYPNATVLGGCVSVLQHVMNYTHFRHMY